LVLLVKPVEAEVGHPNGLPVVGHLLARAVDDVGHLVSNDELQVLPTLFL